MYDIDYKLLKALTMVVQEGGFEKAGHVLHISQSAVSHRVRLLEDQIGQILLTRTSPPSPTHLGRQLIKHYYKVKMLEIDLFESIEMCSRESSTTLIIGLNVDSLATWFLGAVEAFLKQKSILLDLIVDDQAHTHRLLKEGKVTGCISSRPDPMQGCIAEYLGSINYHLIGTVEYAKKWFPRGVDKETLSRAPILLYNRKDEIHKKLIEIILGEVPGELTVHYLPAVEKFTDFIRSGMACGMCDLPTDEVCVKLLESGELVDLAPHHFINLKLYWHSWNLKSKFMEKFSRVLVSRARKILLK